MANHRPHRPIPDRNGDAMRQAVIPRLSEDARRVFRLEVRPGDRAGMGHAPTHGRIEEQKAVLRIVFNPPSRVGLVKQGRVVEPYTKANGKPPVAGFNQTLQLVIYLFGFDHVRSEPQGLRLRMDQTHRNRPDHPSPDGDTSDWNTCPL